MSGDSKPVRLSQATEPSPRRRRARGSLSAEQILDAAQELVERDGLRQLSMPLLAQHVGSGVTSIYWYFRSKDALVEALAQRVLSNVHQQLPPVGDGPWDQELFRYFDAFHGLLQTLPAYREVVAYGADFIVRSRLTHAAQRRLDDGLALLAGAGLSAQEAADVFGVCLSYTRGFVALRHGVRHEFSTSTPGEKGPDPVEELNRTDDDRYRQGLRLLIRGVGAELVDRERAT
jgi:AcrR family transcriptional regulator